MSALHERSWAKSDRSTVANDTEVKALRSLGDGAMRRHSQHFVVAHPRLLSVARWAVLSAAVAVAVFAAASEWIYKQDLTPSAGLIITGICVVVGAIVSAVAWPT